MISFVESSKILTHEVWCKDALISIVQMTNGKPLSRFIYVL